MRFGGNRRFGSSGGNRRFGGDRDRRFNDRRDSSTAPLKVGEEYDVEIKEVGSKGDGIARINNFVVFVANTKMGEKAHIKIKDVMNRFAIGEKVEGGSKTEAEAETQEVKETSSDDDWDSDEEPEDADEGSDDEE